jgi:protein ImuA
MPDGSPVSTASPCAERVLRLAERDGLWLAGRMGAASAPGLATGFAALDAELPGGGWPAAGLTELLLPEPGSGELRLLSPGLARLGRPVLWIAPPFMPYAPALRAQGWSLSDLHWVDPQGEADAAWAAEQALRSRACAAVLWWTGGRTAMPVLRRLHLAAQEGRLPLFALRPLTAAGQSSPAPLRLACAAAPAGRIEVALLKRRGPARDAPLALTPAPAFIPKASARLPATPAAADPVAAIDHAVVRPGPALVAA